MKNPWSRRWVGYIHNDSYGAEKQLARQEAMYSKQQPVYKCPHCGGRAYHRPGVGGWWCDKCGELVWGASYIKEYPEVVSE